MRVLGEIAESPFSISRLTPNSTAIGGEDGGFIAEWVDRCHGFFHNTVLVAASLLFVAYLVYEAKKSLSKLSSRRSYIMIAYYGCLWIVSLLNLAWCCLQAWECTPGKEVVWNLLSLFTTSGMLFLEVSLVAFLFKGNYASGVETLTRTFLISGLIVGLDLFFKAIYLFGFGVPLFIDNAENIQKFKWGLWVIHKLLLTGVYGMIFFMYNSKWRERLPARPAFYKYVTIMFALNGFSLFACALTANGASFGFWLYGIASVCYHAFYLPLLYVTFLADFFQEEDLNLENVYYSEMKDAGFFDDDWE
ncbi:PREDICTED: transmembrane protein adipocyte-associated 1 [Tarenaya hassleriana]|uniref:transmembrane protein adipocyte-associated 1 n=1 Tax=Tarenaya hassleriana TaxID=28532 RepID=UPI00053C4708|nr:PREDICTED: transmembrane protein adipocyte-associated 1 [Tarenaya hassleriana]